MLPLCPGPQLLPSTPARLAAISVYVMFVPVRLFCTFTPPLWACRKAFANDAEAAAAAGEHAGA
jgi:hypothetical protein